MQYEVFSNPLETNTMLNSSITGNLIVIRKHVKKKFLFIFAREQIEYSIYEPFIENHKDRHYEYICHINGVSLEAVMAYIKGYQHQEREKDQVFFDCMLENVQSYEKHYGY